MRGHLRGHKAAPKGAKRAQQEGTYLGADALRSADAVGQERGEDAALVCGRARQPVFVGRHHLHAGSDSGVRVAGCGFRRHGSLFIGMRVAELKRMGQFVVVFWVHRVQ